MHARSKHLASIVLRNPWKEVRRGIVSFIIHLNRCSHASTGYGTGESGHSSFANLYQQFRSRTYRPNTLNRGLSQWTLASFVERRTMCVVDITDPETLAANIRLAGVIRPLRTYILELANASPLPITEFIAPGFGPDLRHLLHVNMISPSTLYSVWLPDTDPRRQVILV